MTILQVESGGLFVVLVFWSNFLFDFGFGVWFFFCGVFGLVLSLGF